MIEMSTMTPNYKQSMQKMTLDEAIAKTRTTSEDAAYLELQSVWTNQRD